MMSTTPIIITAATTRSFRSFLFIAPFRSVTPPIQWVRSDPDLAGDTAKKEKRTGYSSAGPYNGFGGRKTCGSYLASTLE